MTYETILFDVEDGVATLTLNRPEVMNGLNAAHAPRDPRRRAPRPPRAARVLVLTGAGRGFCSGQDLGRRRIGDDLDLERTLRDEYEPMLRAIYDCPIPTIAAVNGAAAGAGANLALACDVVIAAQSAVFIQAFARIGLIPDAGGTYWLPRQVGFARAMGAALFAEPVTADEAAAWGMIWQAVPDEDFAADRRRPRRPARAGPDRGLPPDQAGAPRQPRQRPRRASSRSRPRCRARPAAPATSARASPPSSRSARPRYEGR